MRISAIEGDSGYSPIYQAVSEVLFNGEPLPKGQMPMTADEEKGVIVLMKRGEDGRFLRGEYEEIFGTVEVVPLPGMSRADLEARDWVMRDGVIS